MHTEFFEISSCFCGAPRSGNGGYICGRIAKHLHGSVTVRLKVPPPLNTELRLESTEQEAQSYAGFKTHAFPGCFVCEPGRAPKDGLRILRVSFSPNACGLRWIARAPLPSHLAAPM